MKGRPREVNPTTEADLHPGSHGHHLPKKVWAAAPDFQVKVGDTVLVTGKVVLDKDFGCGYNPSQGTFPIFAAPATRLCGAHKERTKGTFCFIETSEDYCCRMTIT